jgi:hypothetical protein
VLSHCLPRVPICDRFATDRLVCLAFYTQFRHSKCDVLVFSYHTRSSSSWDALPLRTDFAALTSQIVLTLGQPANRYNPDWASQRKHRVILRRRRHPRSLREGTLSIRCAGRCPRRLVVHLLSRRRKHVRACRGGSTPNSHSMNACAMLRKSKDPVRALPWRQRLSKTSYYALMNRCRVVQEVADAWTRTRAEQPPPETNLGRFLWIAPDRRFELFDYTVLESWHWHWHCCT